MSKAFELDRGERVLRKQEGGRAHKSDEPLFHNIPPCLNTAHCTAVIFGVEDFITEFANPHCAVEAKLFCLTLA